MMEPLQLFKEGKLKEAAILHKKEISAFVQKLKKKKPRELDKIVHQLHEEAFLKIDCLECANCCSSISPTLYDKDIDRLSKALKIKPSVFTETYLKLDEEGDYVFKETPCPFLLPDNYCLYYEARPKACREYPHTDRKRFYQILKLSVKNMEVCPAAYNVMMRLYNEHQHLV